MSYFIKNFLQQCMDCLSTVSFRISVNETAYSTCSTCPPFARTHACRRFLHLLRAASTTLCCRPLQTSTICCSGSSTLWICTSHTRCCMTLRINGVQGRTVADHSSGERKSALSRCRSSIVSSARCAGALFY